MICKRSSVFEYIQRIQKKTNDSNQSSLQLFYYLQRNLLPMNISSILRCRSFIFSSVLLDYSNRFKKIFHHWILPSYDVISQSCWLDGYWNTLISRWKSANIQYFSKSHHELTVLIKFCQSISWHYRNYSVAINSRLSCYKSITLIMLWSLSMSYSKQILGYRTFTLYCIKNGSF